MKRLLMLIAPLVILGCAGVTGPREVSSLKLINPSGTPLERHILARRRELASLNANLGDPQPIIVTNRTALLRRFARSISGRLGDDLLNIYRRSVRAAEETYLILMRRDGNYIVFVIRVADVGAEGNYTNLEGLIYGFHPNGTEPDFVTPTHY